MSRGLGKLQSFWLRVASAQRGLWTFDELCRSAFPESYKPGFEMRPSVKRSLRRALRRMIDDNNIVAVGGGGPSDPHRYCINPTLFPDEDSRRNEAVARLVPFGFCVVDGILALRHHH
jgi:hypothetical protein